MTSLDVLSTTNPKILDFFSKHKSLDFEETILSFISIINKLEDNINNNISNDNILQILSEIKSVNHNFKNIESSITKQSLSFLQMLSEFKKQFIDDLRLNLSSNISEKYER